MRFTVASLGLKSSHKMILLGFSVETYGEEGEAQEKRERAAYPKWTNFSACLLSLGSAFK